MIKVCGMREPENINAVSLLPIEYIGGIFYKKSPRYIGDREDTAQAFRSLPESISPVGVFVNESYEEIQKMHDKFSLKAIQLHGNESPEFCAKIREMTSVIKAFGLSEGFDFSSLKHYESSVDLFVFDTSCKEHGGSGRKFNWSILEEYAGKIPFLLSGGIGPSDAALLQLFSHTNFAGIDLNSAFEIKPALKNTELLRRFIDVFRQ